MKSCTDIPQSEKLAEILPIKSADMFYWRGVVLRRGNYKAMDTEFDIPCWSLAALLDVLPTGKVLLHDKWNHGYKCICNNIDSYYFNNPVDACVEMILKLKEKNLL